MIGYGLVWIGAVRCGLEWLEVVGHDLVWLSVVGYDLARLGVAGHDLAWSGVVRNDLARLVVVGRRSAETLWLYSFGRFGIIKNTVRRFEIEVQKNQWSRQRITVLVGNFFNNKNYHLRS